MRVRSDADVAEVASAPAAGGDAAHDGLRARVRHVVLHFGRELHDFARDREEQRGDLRVGAFAGVIADHGVRDRAAAEQRDVPADARFGAGMREALGLDVHARTDVLQHGVGDVGAGRGGDRRRNGDLAFGVAGQPLDDRRARAFAGVHERVGDQGGIGHVVLDDDRLVAVDAGRNLDVRSARVAGDGNRGRDGAKRRHRRPLRECCRSLRVRRVRPGPGRRSSRCGRPS